MTTTKRFIQPRTPALVQMCKKASGQDRAILGAMHDHYESEVQRMTRDNEAPHNIAYTLHGLINDGVATILATPNGQKVQCKAGCAACCRLHVNITDAEASLLVIAAQQEGVAIDWDKAREQAQWTFAQWNKQTADTRRCLFLSHDDLCRLYDYRPANCRKYLVMSDPQFCDTDAHPHHRVEIVASPDAEVITSAALAVRESGSLPAMVLKAKEAMHDA